MPIDYVARDLDSIPSARRVIWTRANLSEVLPELPAPGSWAALEQMLNKGTRRYYGRLLAPVEELGPTFAMIAGRPYWNLTQFSWLAGYARMSPAALMRSVGQASDVSSADAEPVRHSLLEFVVASPAFLRLALTRLLLPVLLRVHFRRLRRLREAFAATDPSAIGEAAIMARIQSLNRLGPLFIARTQAIVGLLSFEAIRPLEWICGRFRFPANRLLDSYLAVGKRSISGQQAFDLVRLGHVAKQDERIRSGLGSNAEPFADVRSRLEGTEFLREFDRFLETYGHRAPFESDPSIPRYREDPSPVLAAIRNYAKTEGLPTSDAIESRQQLEAPAVWREFVTSVPGWKRPIVVPAVRLLLRKAKRAYALRELNRFEIVRVGEHLRRFILAVGERFVGKGWLESASDMFFLAPDEAAAAVTDPAQGPKLGARVSERRRYQQDVATFEAPAMIDGREQGPRPAPSPLVATASELEGLCISSGVTEGEVVVMRDPSEFERMRPHAILVAPATDPAWTPLFVQAAGIIVEVGGQISHAAIVARELGLPALANVRDATRLLNDGDVVRLDASNGTVQVVRRRDS